MKLPSRHEGDHHSIGHIVRQEAEWILGHVPYTGKKTDQYPHEHKIGLVEDAVWSWLRSGWTRLRDDGKLVHWHPEAEDWVPYSQGYHDTLVRLFGHAKAFITHKLDQYGGH